MLTKEDLFTAEKIPNNAFAPMPSEANKLKFINPMHRLIFKGIMELASYSDQHISLKEVENGAIFITYEMIAEIFGVELKVVLRCLKRLVERRLVSTRYIHGIGSIITVTYKPFYHVNKLSKNKNVECGVEYSGKNGDYSVFPPIYKKLKKDKKGSLNSQHTALDKNDAPAMVTDIIDYLNQKIGSKFKPTTKSYVKHISARIAEGATFDEFVLVIDTKCKHWLGSPEYCKNLNPDTLFRPSNFERYLQEASIRPQSQKDSKKQDLFLPKSLTDELDALNEKMDKRFEEEEERLERNAKLSAQAHDQPSRERGVDS